MQYKDKTETSSTLLYIGKEGDQIGDGEVEEFHSYTIYFSFLYFHPFNWKVSLRICLGKMGLA